ncbi:MAG: ABC transporter ATP-binding protein [Desulfuromonas sp.]|nr:ABC transporter ATP-binding protein [Desulfuromonas sp.]
MSTETPIVCEHLSKSFRSKKFKRVQALDDVSFHVLQGTVCGFLGPNGAGKSTTIKILTHQIRPQKGVAKLMGLGVSAPESRRRLGYLPENPSFHDTLTGREILNFAGSCHGIAKNALPLAVIQVLARLGLAHAADRPVRGYSKGMVQRLGLAHALIHDPDLLILDEPSSGLDPLGRALVRDIIREEKLRGKTVFFSTHVVSDVEQVCDHVLIVDQGRVKADAPLIDLQRQADEGHYQVLVRDPDGKTREELVYASALHAVLKKAEQCREVVESVRPQESALERVFLRLVETKKTDINM